MQNASLPLVVSSPRIGIILKTLADAGITGLHATNGTYAPPADLVLPTTAAGFQYLADTHPDKQAAFVIAINSNASMRNLLAARNAPAAEYTALESQMTRAHKVALPLAAQFPARRIVVLFYDEGDPATLYDGLAQSGAVAMRSLHKWGYGATPDAKPILGAESFENVLAFPFPGSTAHIKPVFWDVTPEGQQGHVRVVDLSRFEGPHGAPYLSAQNCILFPVGAAFAPYRQPAGQGGAASSALRP